MQWKNLLLLENIAFNFKVLTCLLSHPCRLHLCRRLHHSLHSRHHCRHYIRRRHHIPHFHHNLRPLLSLRLLQDVSQI